MHVSNENKCVYSLNSSSFGSITQSTTNCHYHLKMAQNILLPQPNPQEHLQYQHQAQQLQHQQTNFLPNLINSHIIYKLKLLENRTEDQHHQHHKQDNYAALEKVATHGR